MHGTKRVVAVGVSLFGVAVLLLILGSTSSATVGTPGQVPSSSVEPVPAYHDSAPTGLLPQTLSPSLFTEPVAQNAYDIAARIKKVLYQQPCYCHCDRSQGHGSLLDCFTGQHAAECGVCTREDFFAYEQTRKGKKPAEIREAIEHGDWRSVDMTKYQKYENAPAKSEK